MAVTIISLESPLSVTLWSTQQHQPLAVPGALGIGTHTEPTASGTPIHGLAPPPQDTVLAWTPSVSLTLQAGQVASVSSSLCPVGFQRQR